MNHLWSRGLLVLALTISLVSIALLGNASRAANHHSCLYAPWVPNGVEIYDPVTEQTSGPYFGQITVQNLEDEEIIAYFTSFNDCNTPNYGGYQHVVIGPRQFVTYSADATGVIPEGTGGGVVVSARPSGDSSKRARIAAIQRQLSPSASLFPGRSTADHVTTSGYTVLDEWNIGSVIFLPIAQTNNNWNTLIHVSNFDPDFGTLVELELHPAGGGAALGPYSVPLFQGETATFDMRDLGVPHDFVGSASITSHPDAPIGAVAERIKVETNMLLMNTSRVDPSLEGGGESATFAPLIFRDWNFWNTGLSVGNFADQLNEVTVTFYDMDGDEVFNDSKTLPPRGMDYFYLPAGDEAPFVGSAIVQGTQPLYGAVDEVKYFGDDLDTGHAMSYMLHSGVPTREGRSLTFPFYARGNPVNAGGDTSGIQIFNIGDDAAEVEIMFYHQNGDPALSEPDGFVLQGGQSYTAYSLDYDELPVGFFGSAVVTNVAPGLPGESGIIGVTNLVNYDVQYDGSATYNHTLVPLPAEENGGNGDDEDDEL